MRAEPDLEPRKLPRQRRAQATFDAILAATARVLVAEGYEAATTNRVAEVAGVSIGTLYQYFPNKESLVLAVIRQHCDEMLGLLQTSVATLGDAPLPVAVRTYVTAMLEAHRMDPDLHRVLIQQALHLGLEHIHGVQLMSRAVVRAWLEGHRDEVLPRDLDAAAFVLVTAVESVTHAAILERPLPVSMEVLAEEIIAFVLRYLTGAGLAPHRPADHSPSASSAASGP